MLLYTATTEHAFDAERFEDYAELRLAVFPLTTTTTTTTSNSSNNNDNHLHIGPNRFTQ